MLVFPYYTDNPYTDLLYSSVKATGYDIRGVLALDQFEYEVADIAAGDIVHAQWGAPIWRGSRDEKDAWLRLERFERSVLGALGRGAVLVWTVHNAVSHESRFFAPEVALARFLSDQATAIHVMNPATAEVVVGDYRLPLEKITVIPHCSYLGVYPESITKQDAREFFRIPTDHMVVLFFGQMRAYKGLESLFQAMAGLASRRQTTLLLVGRTHPDDVFTIESTLPSNLRVIRKHLHVDAEETQRWFAAADITVLPYRKVLNSGTAHLSATLGVPVLLPDLPHLTAQFEGESWVHYFPSTGGAIGLEEALAKLETDDTEHANARQFAALFSPRKMADAFRDFLEKVRSESLGGQRRSF